MVLISAGILPDFFSKAVCPRYPFSAPEAGQYLFQWISNCPEVSLTPGFAFREWQASWRGTALWIRQRHTVAKTAALRTPPEALPARMDVGSIPHPATVTTKDTYRYIKVLLTPYFSGYYYKVGIDLRWMSMYEQQGMELLAGLAVREKATRPHPCPNTVDCKADS